MLRLGMTIGILSHAVLFPWSAALASVQEACHTMNACSTTPAQVEELESGEISATNVELLQKTSAISVNADNEESIASSSQTRRKDDVMPGVMHWSKFDVRTFHELGYAVLQGVYAPQEIDAFAEQVLHYVESDGSMFQGDGGGGTIANFRIEPTLTSIFESIDQNEKIHKVLGQAVGDCVENDGKIGPAACNYRWCSHNDIGMDRNVTWHKDRLNGVYRSFELKNPWDVIDGNTSMRIVKVALYFEDHDRADDHDSLTLLPSSHTTEEIPEAKESIRFLHPKKGDVVIFDQRITHRGRGPLTEIEHPEEEASLLSTGQVLRKERHRIMVSIGYGHNNVFTDEFEQGTIARQDQWNNNECGNDAYGNCSIAEVTRYLEKIGLPVYVEEVED